MNPEIIVVLMSVIIVIAIPIVIITTAIKKAKSDRMFKAALEALTNSKGFQQFDDRPRSLNGCESIYLPEIRKDFPDFNPTSVYTDAKRALEELLSDKKSLKIHRVVISGYDRTLYEKTVILQAALQYEEAGQLLQKRYIMLYSYFLNKNGTTLTSNCPNCGAPISDSSLKACPFCNSLLVNPLGGEWKFADIEEG